MPDSSASAQPVVLDHLAEYVRTAAELAAAFAAADPAAAVPSCPGWTVADLALHLGTGERWAAAILLSSTHQKEPTVLRTPASWSDWYSGTSAAILYLALWKRLPATSLVVEGDPAVADTFLTGKGTP